MTNEKFDSGGPVFPSEQICYLPDHVFALGDKIPVRGILLWDYYAAHALAQCNLEKIEHVASYAGQIADALLKERKTRFK